MGNPPFSYDDDNRVFALRLRVFALRLRVFALRLRVFALRLRVFALRLSVLRSGCWAALRLASTYGALALGLKHPLQLSGENAGVDAILIGIAVRLGHRHNGANI